MDVLTHSIWRPESNQRELFALDGYMNHSCQPNTNSCGNKSFSDESGGCYTTVCIRDINVGDQITCDYDLIEWDCPDKGIDKCSCGSATCRGRVWGFKHLSESEQKSLTPFASENVLTALRNAGKIDQAEFEKLNLRRETEKPEDLKNNVTK